MGINITARSLEVFLEYAKDADNWSGAPLVGGNVLPPGVGMASKLVGGGLLVHSAYRFLKATEELQKEWTPDFIESWFGQ